jgi:hypothetical protein
MAMSWDQGTGFIVIDFYFGSGALLLNFWLFVLIVGFW